MGEKTEEAILVEKLKVDIKTLNEDLATAAGLNIATQVIEVRGRASSTDMEYQIFKLSSAYLRLLNPLIFTIK
jgi:hypothetical protein